MADKKIDLGTDSGHVARYAFLFIVLIVVLAIVLSTIVTIDAGDRGVLLTFGKAEDVPLQSGLSFITPFVQQVVHVEVRTQKVEHDASAASKDLQDVATKVALTFHLDPANVVTVYRNLGLGYGQRVIDPAIQESVKAATAQFTAEELITKREVVKDKIKEELRARLAPYSVIVEDIAITNFEFSSGFTQAIEAKVTAEQNALTAQNRLKQIEFEAQQTVATANGTAQSQERLADANAYTILTKARSDAEAIRIKADALRQNPQLVQLEIAQRWNGQLPVVTGGDSVMFLDANKLISGAASSGTIGGGTSSP